MAARGYIYIHYGTWLEVAGLCHVPCSALQCARLAAPVLTGPRSWHCTWSGHHHPGASQERDINFPRQPTLCALEPCCLCHRIPICICIYKPTKNMDSKKMDNRYTLILNCTGLSIIYFIGILMWPLKILLKWVHCSLFRFLVVDMQSCFIWRVHI